VGRSAARIGWTVSFRDSRQAYVGSKALYYLVDNMILNYLLIDNITNIVTSGQGQLQSPAPIAVETSRRPVSRAVSGTNQSLLLP